MANGELAVVVGKIYWTALVLAFLAWLGAMLLHLDMMILNRISFVFFSLAGSAVLVIALTFIWGKD